ncbi:NaeI family type II restriction endonuclease [Amycolatopsis pigmentata]|uniref:NaeI family type II restriction endonuclease n=1 Tax=Amycolatopsis pigmentata TaxID=450801 RepID=A0ABW5FR21_9PSEU
MGDTSTLFELVAGGTPRPGQGGTGSVDQGLDEVVAWFRGHEDLEARFGSIFRQSLDEVLDGQRTGRFDIAGLAKTEKTYLGTKVEIVTRAGFELHYGAKMDYEVAGHEIDAKFSITGTWAIPTEAMGHLCLLMSADDHKSAFDVGVIRIRPEVLNRGRNKDGKTTITKQARGSIVWLARNASLPRNLLLSLPQSTVDRIRSAGSGQQRINELLRCVQGCPIDRNTAVTVAQQKDGLKRCRDARRHLRKEGIAVLGHQNDSPKIASALGLPVPEKGTFLSIRLVKVADDTDGRPVVEISGDHYAVSRPGEPVEPVPDIRY